METAGQRLKRVRERLGLRYREVAEASRQIARNRKNPEYAIALSRLADIENKGTVPNIYRLYSMAAIYRVDMPELLGWYGVHQANIPAESAEVPLETTHLAGFAEVLPQPAQPQPEETGHDGSKTAFLSRLHKWGQASSGLLPGFDAQHYRYGYVGLEDWSMYPVLEPGTLVLIDTRRRRIATEGWTGERDRPIYFLEHRDGYWCGWCSLLKDTVVLQPHPASNAPPSVYRYPDQIEVIGEVAGSAVLFGARTHRAASSAGRSASPNR